jgi:hypothetical protein
MTTSRGGAADIKNGYESNNLTPLTKEVSYSMIKHGDITETTDSARLDGA